MFKSFRGKISREPNSTYRSFNNPSGHKWVNQIAPKTTWNGKGKISKLLWRFFPIPVFSFYLQGITNVKKNGGECLWPYMANTMWDNHTSCQRPQTEATMKWNMSSNTYIHRFSIERLSLFVSLSAINIYSSLTTQPGGIISKLIPTRNA